MKIIRFVLTVFLFSIVSASLAKAQSQRTFVSALGSDTSQCSRTAPCRTFAAALRQTGSGGEVYVLDTAGYGPFTINTSVSIVAPAGVTAGISVFSGDGIDINAGPSDTVVLRGLTVINQGGTGSGIVFNTGGTLHVENCVVDGFSGSSGTGLAFNGAGNLEVKDSIFRGNKSGISIFPYPATASATIDQVRIEGGGAGLDAQAGSNVTVRNSLASGNRNQGFGASSGSTLPAELDMENCISSHNGIGISSDGTAPQVGTVRLSNSSVTDNVYGLALTNTGVILSRGNNTVEGNAVDVKGGTLGSYAAK